MFLRAICASLIVLIANTAIAQERFTPSQQEQIGEIIREYLLKNPEVISEAAAELEKRRVANEQASREKAIKQNKRALERGKGDPVGGNPEGEITVVEFFDYNCPFCRKAKPVVQRLLRDDKRIRYVFKEFPILSETSRTAARVALAVWKLAPEKYWSLHNGLMKANGRVTDAGIQKAVAAVGLKWDEVIKASESKDIEATIANNLALAQALNINGTPTFVVGTEVFPGLVPLTTLKAAVGKLAQ